MKGLHNLSASVGARKRRKRVGRGESSGHGKFSGRGTGGQGSRTGKGKPRAGFEGGQTPMYRRMPKRGFHNIFARRCAEINVGTLGSFFSEGSVVDLDALRGRGLVKRNVEALRILGRGELSHSLRVVADHFSDGARVKLEKAGGVAELRRTEGTAAQA